MHTLRSVLQAVTVLVTHYGYLVAIKTELFYQRLLSGVNEATHLAQQVLCMNALRTICLCPPTVHFLHITCDAPVHDSTACESRPRRLCCSCSCGSKCSICHLQCIIFLQCAFGGILALRFAA